MGVEDSTGPWELLWWLRDRFPDEDEPNLLAVAQAALTQLVRDGLIQLVSWDPDTNTERGLDRAESERVVRGREPWDGCGPLQPHVRFTATAAGERAYYAHALPV